MIELDYEVISHLDEPQDVGALPRFCAVSQSADSAEQAAVQYVQQKICEGDIKESPVLLRLRRDYGRDRGEQWANIRVDFSFRTIDLDQANPAPVELLPCPFCKSTDLDQSKLVECRRCGASAQHPAVATKRMPRHWNTRK